MSVIRRLIFTLTIALFVATYQALAAANEGGHALQLIAKNSLGRFTEAGRLIEANKYEAAVRAIEQEIAREAPAGEELVIYDALAVAALRAHRNEIAFAAALHAIACGSSSELPWGVLHELQPTPSAFQSIALPDEFHEDVELLSIVRCDYYSTWPSFGVRPCTTRYIALAEKLAKELHPDAAARLRLVAAAALVDHASSALSRRDFARADDLLELMSTIDLTSAPDEVRISMYVLLATVDQHEYRFLHAVADYEEIAKISGHLPPLLQEPLADMLHEVFKSVSWDPATGNLRTADEDDFFDNVSIDGPELPKDKNGKRIPYGMTSADEDDATLATALFADGVATRFGKPSVNSIIKQRLESHNFELPVKVVLFQITPAMLHQVPTGDDAKALDALFESIDTGIQTSDGVADATVVAFEVAKRARKLWSSD